MYFVCFVVKASHEVTKGTKLGVRDVNQKGEKNEKLLFCLHWINSHKRGLRALVRRYRVAEGTEAVDSV